MGQDAFDLRRRQKAAFFRKGIALALASGICYGLYTAFLTLAETQGVWGEWFSGGAWGAGNPALSEFSAVFALAALAAGFNDTFSGLWSLAVCAKGRQLGDFARTLKTKPGLVMIVCALIGGPFATIAYVVALNSAAAAGSPGVIVPIAALNCAIGAILGRAFFRQNLTAHKIAGIIVCLVAGGLIGGASFATIGPEVLPCCLFAFLAAFGWGFEGCVAGFGTVLIDYRIGICIRQLTAGAIELFVAFPLLMLVGGDTGLSVDMMRSAFADPATLIFLISGLFAMPAYSLWYKGNSMCGAALGMACNGMYAFWGPFFIWVVMGLFNIGGMSADYPPLSIAQWAGAVMMVTGIFCIAVSPLAAARKIVQARMRPRRSVLPLNYAVLNCFTDGGQRCADDVVSELMPQYGTFKLLSRRGVDESLATAAENGLLEETRSSLDDSGTLKVYYAISEYGKEMLERYVKPCKLSDPD